MVDVYRYMLSLYLIVLALMHLYMSAQKGFSEDCQVWVYDTLHVERRFSFYYSGLSTRVCVAIIILDFNEMSHFEEKHDLNLNPTHNFQL